LEFAGPYQSGDEADLALIKFAYCLVTNLIEILSESFDIIEVEWCSIAGVYQEIIHRNGNVLNNDSTKISSRIHFIRL